METAASQALTAVSGNHTIHMEIGQPFPIGQLGLDEQGEEISLDQFASQRLVLYFYPKDNTPGCTQEACSMRDNYETLMAQGYAVVGVSPDSAASHRKFQEKHQLPFHLIADTDHRLAEALGVWGEKKMCGRTYMGVLRTTFVIAPDGTLERIFTAKQIKVKEHAQQILAN